MQGVKVGTVTGIRFDPRRSDKVVLQLTIEASVCPCRPTPRRRS